MKWNQLEVQRGQTYHSVEDVCEKTHRSDSSTVKVRWFWHDRRQLGPLKGLQVDLPQVRQDDLSIIAATYKDFFRWGKQTAKLKKIKTTSDQWGFINLLRESKRPTIFDLHAAVTPSGGRVTCYEPRRRYLGVMKSNCSRRKKTQSSLLTDLFSREVLSPFPPSNLSPNCMHESETDTILKGGCWQGTHTISP